MCTRQRTQHEQRPWGGAKEQEGERRGCWEAPSHRAWEGAWPAGGAAPSCPLLCTHAFSISCSRSWTLRLSSSAGGKVLPTFMKRAAILLLRRKPAARRRSPCRTQASTAAAGTRWSAGPHSLTALTAHAPHHAAGLGFQSHRHRAESRMPRITAF